MRKTFAVVIAIILLLIIIIILLPHFIKRNNNINDDNSKITCEFNFEEISNKLTTCLNKTIGKNLTMIINNVILSETEKTIKIVYSNTNNKLELYFDDNLIFSEEKIDSAKKIQDITIFNDEIFILAYYTQSEIKYDTGNVIGFDNIGNLSFQLKEDDSYYSISSINTNENKINFSKYNYINNNEILKENCEILYLGETIFSDYNLIDTETINIE